MNAINITNLTVGYGGKPVLNQVSCAIARGKLTALIGANGCGKSTLLKSINALQPISSGAITLADGQVVCDLAGKELAKKLSMLPQTPITPEGVTVAQLVGYGRAPYLNFLGQMTQRDKDAVATALEQTDIAELADVPVASLSGGQRQRAWIAMVLAQDTDIILLDEPTTYLDIAHQFELMDLLRSLVIQQQKTIVVVLHDLHQACRYADELVIVNDAKIHSAGRPSEVFTVTMLEQVFGLKARVILDPESQTPMAIPLAKGKLQAA